MSAIRHTRPTEEPLVVSAHEKTLPTSIATRPSRWGGVM
jgi:hypothetical protein